MGPRLAMVGSTQGGEHGRAWKMHGENNGGFDRVIIDFISVL